MPKLLNYLNPKLSSSVIAAVFLSIPAANAETHWLLIKGKGGMYSHLNWTIPTSSKDECEAALDRVVDKDNWVAWRPTDLSRI